MQFNELINRYLKESEEELVHVQRDGWTYGVLFKVPELDKELELNKIMPGTPSVIALEIIQWTIDLVKKYDIYAPSKIEDVQSNCIYTDNFTKPGFIHLNYGWMTKHPAYPRGVHLPFYYKIEALKAPHYTPISYKDHPRHTKSITIDQLKDIREKELTDKAYKDHDLEDMVNF